MGSELCQVHSEDMKKKSREEVEGEGECQHVIRKFHCAFCKLVEKKLHKFC